MSLLIRREHCFAELKQKALRRFTDAEPFAVDEVLERLVELGYLSDSRFAESFIRFRSKKGIGPRRILSELAQKCCDPDAIERSMAESEVDWATILRNEAQKKLKSLKKVTKDQRNSKLTRFLLYRGFDMDAIKACIAEL
tara:strand:+ start:198 stop:617 length:420 start_codon:yes stop_codon:yes gene_type:complete